MEKTQSTASTEETGKPLMVRGTDSEGPAPASRFVTLDHQSSQPANSQCDEVGREMIEDASSPSGAKMTEGESTQSNGVSEQSSTSRGNASESDSEISKAMIIYFPRADGRCYPHQFTSSTKTGDMVGRGAYGDVFRVECTLCHNDFAKKVIRFAPWIQQRARKKHIRDTDMELRCYMTLDHPHIIEYVHHELGDAKMEIYTEFCQLKDLETTLKKNQVMFPDTLTWTFAEALGSALSRCHYGLEATREGGSLRGYIGFPSGWRTILHRDVKPGNVLIAFRNEELDLVPKLGDFGTSFQLQDGDALPTSHAGTRVYWAPEIAEEAQQYEGRITKWSSKGDIWGVGAVLHRILTKEIPRTQAANLTARIDKLQSLAAGAGREPISPLLAQVTAECLDPDPERRLSALSVLAVAAKSDTGPNGIHRSASFWRTLARFTDDVAVVSSVVAHFVTEHLPLLADLATLFGPEEVVLIMSLCKMHCPAKLSTCHMQLCRGFDGNMTCSTVFHALAGIGQDCFDILQLAWDESKWPQEKDLLHVTIRKNSLGLLPSAIAALRGNMDLCLKLTQLEDEARMETAKRASAAALNALQQRLETVAHKEFEFMFKMLTMGNSEQLVIPVTHMQGALIDTAQLGYRNVVRKLLEVGVPVSVRGRHHETALHVFAHAGEVSMVRLLLERGAEVDARDRNGSTPLHWASWAGKLDTARELLMSGADINALDKLSRSPLFGAAGGGYADVVRLLLVRGADKSLRGGKGKQTPLEKAASKRRNLVVELLQE